MTMSQTDGLASSFMTRAVQQSDISCVVSSYEAQDLIFSTIAMHRVKKDTCQVQGPWFSVRIMCRYLGV